MNTPKPSGEKEGEGGVYEQIITQIFEERYTEGAEMVFFERPAIAEAARTLGLDPPKNLGDLIYSYKFRRSLPAAIQATAPEDREWVLVNKGRAQYAFELRTEARITPDEMLVVAKIPDATPGIVERYALDDEQALLAKLRYNRLIDTFTGVTCYSIQNHLRTTVSGIGQVETDEIYVGVDRQGAHYVFPVQAKGGSDELSIVQIEQDIALCEEKFEDLICRAIAAQFMANNVIALFEFEVEEERVRKSVERHYELVAPEDLTAEELRRYRNRATAV